MADDIKVVVDARDLQLLRRELVGVAKDAKSSASVFEREFRKVENALVKSARSSQAYYNETLKVDRATKSASQSARAMEAAFKKQDIEAKKVAKTLKHQALANRKLRMEYKQGYASKVQLRLEQMRLSSAFKRGIIDADEYKASLDRLGAAAGRSGRSMNRTGVLVQQSGYQIGDFLVQVQSGTNAMVAFGQQATQVAGTLTILGGKWIGIGTVLGITIPLLTAVGAYFMRTRKAAEDGADGIDTYADAAKDAREEIRKTRLETEALNRGFRDTQELTLEQGIAEATAELAAAQKAMNDTLAQARGETTSLSPFSVRDAPDRLVTSLNVVAAAEEEVKKRKEILRLLLEQRATEEAVTRGMEARQAMLDAEAEALQERNEAVSAIRDAMAAQTSEMQNRIALIQAEVMWGKESEQLASLQAQQARDAFIEEQKRNGILGNNLQTQLDIYDALVDAEEALVEVNEGQGALKEGAESLLSIWTSITDKIKEAAAATPEPTVGRGRGFSAGAGSTEIERILMGMGGEVIPGKAGTTQSTSSGSGTTRPDQDITDLVDILIAANEEFVKAREASEAFADSLAAPFSDGFTSIVDGTKSVEDAFREMARNVVKQLWDVYVMQQIIGSAKAGTGIAGTIASVFQADGGAWNKGVQMFANGGVVNSPTMFGHSGGVGMMGEAGPEAIMPLKRGANGKLGVQMEGGGGTVNQTINISLSANGDDSVKKIVAQAVPQITEAAKKAVINDRRRGGSMKAAFG